MKILFVLKQLGYVRHFDGVVRALADRGHYVRLASQDGDRGLPPLLERHPHITVVECPSKRGDQWQEHASLVRRVADYARYLTPPFRGATKLRARAFDKLVRTLSHGKRGPGEGWAEAPLALSPSEVTRVLDLVHRIEATVPADESLTEFVRSEAPDVLLVTPLIDIGSGQTDFIKSARLLGIPSAMVLFSWDNLTTKGIIHEVPDSVVVWNELQRREAIELHKIPRSKIVITGAPRFDAFFDAKSIVPRETFCSLLGFDPAQPIVTYLGSSKFVSESEDGFIDTWLAQLRQTPALRDANVLIKPHPDLNRDAEEEGERLVVYTPAGDLRFRRYQHPTDRHTTIVRTGFTAMQFLYETLFHSAAVVGLNTSAELEAAIVGRPVLTIKVPDALADGQDSTLHFHYLLAENGGFVHTATSLADHVIQLVDAVAGKFDVDQQQQFIQSFLRPHGAERPATKEMLRAVERLYRKPRVANREQTEPAAAESAADAEGLDPAASDRRDVSPDNQPVPTTTVLLDYPAAPVRLVVTSEAERRWRAVSCQKEPWTVRWIENNLRTGSVLYDIGANVGTFSLLAARRVPGAKVVSFEPGYASYAHLCDNIVLNGCQDTVFPIPVPLWSATEPMTLRYRSTEPGQSRHAMRERSGGKTSSERYHQPVLAFSLDDLVRQFALPLPTMVKLDVDGAETNVLTGAATTLLTPELETLLVEFEEEQRDGVTSRLAAAGFTVITEVAREKRAGAPVYAEFRRPT